MEGAGEGRLHLATQQVKDAPETRSAELAPGPDCPVHLLQPHPGTGAVAVNMRSGVWRLQLPNRGRCQATHKH